MKNPNSNNRKNIIINLMLLISGAIFGGLMRNYTELCEVSPYIWHKIWPRWLASQKTSEKMESDVNLPGGALPASTKPSVSADVQSGLALSEAKKNPLESIAPHLLQKVCVFMCGDICESLFHNANDSLLARKFIEEVYPVLKTMTTGYDITVPGTSIVDSWFFNEHKPLLRVMCGIGPQDSTEEIKRKLGSINYELVRETIIKMANYNDKDGIRMRGEILHERIAGHIKGLEFPPDREYRIAVFSNANIGRGYEFTNLGCFSWEPKPEEFSRLGKTTDNLRFSLVPKPYAGGELFELGPDINVEPGPGIIPGAIELNAESISFVMVEDDKAGIKFKWKHNKGTNYTFYITPDEIRVANIMCASSYYPVAYIAGDNASEYNHYKFWTFGGSGPILKSRFPITKGKLPNKYRYLVCIGVPPLTWEETLVDRQYIPD